MRLKCGLFLRSVVVQDLLYQPYQNNFHLRECLVANTLKKVYFLLDLDFPMLSFPKWMLDLFHMNQC